MVDTKSTQESTYKAFPTPIVYHLGTVDEWGRMNIRKDMDHLVAFLTVREGDFYEPIGTVFFLHHAEGSHVFSYICTCRHVVRQPLREGQQLYIRVNLKDETGVQHIPLHNGWIYYEDCLEGDEKPDDLVDLAVLPIEPVDMEKASVFASIPAHFAFGEDGVRREYNRPVIPSDEVVFLGLFQNYVGHTRNYPIYRFGRISLVSSEPLPGVEPWLGMHGYYLVECQAYPGMSGSPVFMPYPEKKDGFFLIGIMAGYYKEDEQIEGKFTHYGISQMVPAYLLGEIIYSPKLDGERKDKMKKIKIGQGPRPASGKSPSPTFPPRQIQKVEQGEITREQFEASLRRAFRPDTEDETSDEEK